MRIAQAELVILDTLVPEKHTYRRLKKLIDFQKIVKAVGLPEKESAAGATGFRLERLIMCLVLQFMEDLSDREMERFIAENTSAKWFCDFTITEKTPDYSVFSKLRKRLGCKQISNIFTEVQRQLKSKGYLTEIFTFIDATALTSKLSIWEEKDKSIQDGYEKLNNVNLPKYEKDKDVRIGAKSKNKLALRYFEWVTPYEKNEK